MSDKMKQLNPSKGTTTIGVRELKEITVYPLSVGCQLQLSDVITEVLRKYFGAKEDGQALATQMDDVAIVHELVDLIRDNISKIIGFVTEEGPALLDDMTNDQLADMALIIYEMNYESAGKKFMSLVRKVTGTTKISTTEE